MASANVATANFNELASGYTAGDKKLAIDRIEAQTKYDLALHEIENGDYATDEDRDDAKAEAKATFDKDLAQAELDWRTTGRAAVYNTYANAENTRIDSRNDQVHQEGHTYDTAMSGHSNTYSKATTTNAGTYSVDTAQAAGDLVEEMGDVGATYKGGRLAAQAAAGSARAAVMPEDSSLNDWAVAQEDIWNAESSIWNAFVPDLNGYYSAFVGAFTGTASTVSGAATTAGHGIADSWKDLLNTISGAELAFANTVEATITDYVGTYDSATATYDDAVATAKYNEDSGTWSAQQSSDHIDAAVSNFGDITREEHKESIDEVAEARKLYSTTTINAAHSFVTDVVGLLDTYHYTATDAVYGAGGFARSTAALDRDITKQEAEERETGLADLNTNSPSPWAHQEAEEAKLESDRVDAVADAKYDKEIDEADADEIAADDRWEKAKQKTLAEALKAKNDALKEAERAYAEAIEQEGIPDAPPSSFEPPRYQSINAELLLAVDDGQADTWFNGDFSVEGESNELYFIDDPEYLWDWDGEHFENSYLFYDQNHNASRTTRFKGHYDWEGEKINQRKIDKALGVEETPVEKKGGRGSAAGIEAYSGSPVLYRKSNTDGTIGRQEGTEENKNHPEGLTPEQEALISEWLKEELAKRSSGSNARDGNEEFDLIPENGDLFPEEILIPHSPLCFGANCIDGRTNHQPPSFPSLDTEDFLVAPDAESDAAKEVALDMLRAMLILGDKALASEALKPGLFRGLQPREVGDFTSGNGLRPVPGTKPSPAGSIIESSFRHLRPGGNALIKGTDRISWADNFLKAEKLAQINGSNQVAVINREVAESLGIQIYSPQELLEHLAAQKKLLEEDLAKAVGKNKQNKIRNSITALTAAEQYVKKYGEFHTVGPIPDGALDPKAVARIKLARNVGRVLVGLSIYISIQKVLSAEPDRQTAVLVDEVAATGLDMLVPTAGPIGAYATQTVRGELHLLSQLFPTAYTWVIDAYFGEILEEADPEGASYIRDSLKSQWGTAELFQRLFRGF